MNTCKKVKFDETQNKKHILIVWSYAYKQARKSIWEEKARDRFRFQRRIKDVTTVLTKILKSEHRSRIYNERFCNQ